MKKQDLAGKNVLVMGLGLHGGGVATARYLAEAGALVTCTDLRSAEELASSVAALEGTGVRFVLGEHREEDFDGADLIVKNPAVPAGSPWLAGRTNVETDISLFLRTTDQPILAVTGSKGKSTVVSALYHVLKRNRPGTRLGGNITVSPLSFSHDLAPGDPVILELSSWQLADLRGRGLLKPEAACITNLMHDHQNRYASFADYEADKTVILEGQDAGGFAVLPDDEYGRRWSALASGRIALVRPDAGGAPQESGIVRAWLDGSGRGWISGLPEDQATRGKGGPPEEIVPERLKVPGLPFRLNCLFAAAMARLFGCGAEEVRASLAGFEGVPYRMEMFLESGGIRCYDDTAATIPDAAAAAVRAMDRPVVLIAGGTDKDLDFAPFDEAARIAKGIVLLEGSATDKWLQRLRGLGAEILGVCGSMEEAVSAAAGALSPGDALLLSPGAASFGLFRHEFERGDVFKAVCRHLFGSKG